jgi:opacity protein-like surface antigen
MPASLVIKNLHLFGKIGKAITLWYIKESFPEEIFLMWTVLNKRFIIPAVLLLLASQSSAETAFSHKFELRLVAGLSMTETRGDTAYEDEWKLELLSTVVEQNRIFAKSRNAFFSGAFLVYFLKPDFGLEAGLGFFKADVPNTTSFYSEFSWSSGANDMKNAEWTGSGDLRVIPVSLNFFGRLHLGKIEAYGSAGLTLFWNSFRSSALAGFNVSDVAFILTYVPPNWEKTVIQSIDALPVGLEIGKNSWVATGMDIGGGLDFRLSNTVGLAAGFRYYLCPAREFEWKWKPGFYDGIDAVITDWEFTSHNARCAESKTKSPLKVNPSFLQLGLGIKIFL